jgi:cyclopropane fatty-acyl-phospholipid synthase-like methyltransferase
MAPDTSHDRQAFLERRRALGARRMDEIFADRYDEHWGHINETHEEFVKALIDMTSSGSTLLDAACGTGKYAAMILAAGRSLIGIDRSAGMLAEAARKFPGMGVRQLSLERLVDTADLVAAFDGLLCVDAMENVPPEDWPVVLTGFARVLKPGAPLYFTVEIPDEEDRIQAAQPSPPLVTGEVLWPDDHGGAYHYFPQLDQTSMWVGKAGFTLVRLAKGDGYYHLLASLTW